MFQLTAAHRQLPLGTWVKVTNLRNGKWVIVRINDRGPVPESRVIDLSYGAAQLLDLRARGVERVRLDIVTPEVVAMATDLTGQQ
jgi:rare lipoprotein A